MKNINSTQDIPIQRVLVNSKYLCLNTKDKYTKGYWYAITSIPARQFLCHVMLDNGSNWYGLPLESLTCAEQDFIHTPFKDTSYYQGYDCFSYNVQVKRFDFLRDQEVQLLKYNKSKGIYLFTVLSYDVDGASPFSELPEQAKTFTFLKEENSGYYTAMPNNYLAWKDKALYTNPVNDEYPKYKRISKITRSNR